MQERMSGASRDGEAGGLALDALVEALAAMTVAAARSEAHDLRGEDARPSHSTSRYAVEYYSLSTGGADGFALSDDGSAA